MMHCGKTGAVLLYGTSCVRCDCGGARVSFQGREWTVEELERASPRFTAEAEAVIRREAQRRQDRAIDEALMREGFYPSGRVYEEVRSRHRSAGPAGASYVMEVITDPNDRRGFDARLVGAA